MQQSLNRRASTGVVKLSPHSLSCRESFQWTKHSEAWVILVPAWTWKKHEYVLRLRQFLASQVNDRRRDGVLEASWQLVMIAFVNQRKRTSEFRSLMGTLCKKFSQLQQVSHEDRMSRRFQEMGYQLHRSEHGGIVLHALSTKSQKS